MDFKRKGFTLIELLVVIAIIGILSAVVYTSLGSSRTQARDAAILTEMNQITTAVELETNASGDYTNICNLFNANNSLEDLKNSVTRNGGVWESCTSDASSYAIVVTLNAQQAYENYFQVNKAHARAVTTMCHSPGTPEQETIIVHGSIQEHLAHGDTYGECEPLPSDGNSIFVGVHSQDESLLSMKDINNLRQTEGDNFIEPKYYCVGASPLSNEMAGTLKGYLYKVPEGGCGSPAPSFTAAQTAYAERE